MGKFRELTQACRDEKVFGRLLGGFFLLLGLGFIIIGVTVLPIFGLLVGIALLVLAFYFFRKSPGEDEACETDFTKKT